MEFIDDTLIMKFTPRLGMHGDTKRARILTDNRRETAFHPDTQIPRNYILWGAGGRAHLLQNATELRMPLEDGHHEFEHHSFGDVVISPHPDTN